jgi:ubiquinol-cytochrome c reductase cytochrome c1 subunit
MVRIIGFLVGLGFAGVLLISLVVNLVGYIQSPPEATAEHEFHRHPKELHLASDGPFGKFDRQQVQRGYQVYKEVCSACHSMNLVSYRNLAELGYSEAEVKAEAASHEVPGINPETGEVSTRKATPSDHFPAPYPNETAARAANNNALPPDLSLIAKSREGGAAYVHSLLTGFQNQPAELLKEFPAAKTPQGLHYNPYFANLNLAMAPPLTSDGQVVYADGTKSTVDQMATDVSAFLVWTAEPKLEARHRYGITALVFLIIATILGYLSYRNIWAEAKRKVAPKGPLDPANKAKRTRAKAKAGIAG